MRTIISYVLSWMQARGRASVEASNAPRAPLWRPGSSTLATAELSSGNSPRGSHNHSIQPACAEHQVQEAERAGTAEEEVLSPHQSRHSHVERTSQPGAVDQTPADGCHEGTSLTRSSCQEQVQVKPSWQNYRTILMRPRNSAAIKLVV